MYAEPCRPQAVRWRAVYRGESALAIPARSAAPRIASSRARSLDSAPAASAWPIGRSGTPVERMQRRIVSVETPYSAITALAGASVTVRESQAGWSSSIDTRAHDRRPCCCRPGRRSGGSSEPDCVRVLAQRGGPLARRAGGTYAVGVKDDGIRPGGHVAPGSFACAGRCGAQAEHTEWSGPVSADSRGLAPLAVLLVDRGRGRGHGFELRCRSSRRVSHRHGNAGVTGLLAEGQTHGQRALVGVVNEAGPGRRRATAISSASTTSSARM